MSYLSVISEHQIEKKIMRMRNNLLDAGWDDTLRYLQYASGPTREELLVRLLIQSEVLTQEQVGGPAPRGITSYGIPQTAAFELGNPYPSLTRILTASQDPDASPAVKEEASKLLGDLTEFSIPEVEALAQIALQGTLSDTNIPEAFRGVLIALTPVMLD